MKNLYRTLLGLLLIGLFAGAAKHEIEKAMDATLDAYQKNLDLDAKELNMILMRDNSAISNCTMAGSMWIFSNATNCHLINVHYFGGPYNRRRLMKDDADLIMRHQGHTLE